jgi:microcystin-dependent protein
MAVIFGNNAASTVSGTCAANAVQVNVQAGDGVKFPSPSRPGDYFCLTFYDAASQTITEVTHIASRSGDTLTFALDGPNGNGRGHEGTSAASWPAGSPVAALVTAGSLNNFIQTGTGINTSIIYEGDDVGTGGHIVVPILSPTPGGSTPVAGMTIIVNVGSSNNNTLPIDARVLSATSAAAICDLNAVPIHTIVETTSRLMLCYDGSRWQAVNVWDTSVSAIHTGTDNGSVNQISATVTPAISSYANGQQFNIWIGSPTNTSSTVTANFNGLGALPCYRPDGTALQPGDLTHAMEAQFVCAGTIFNVFAKSPSSPITSDAPGDNQIYGRENAGWVAVFLPGMSMDYYGTNAPAGWLLEDGTLYNVSQYPNLYAVIGNTFGGTSGSTFNVPDSRGRFGIGRGSGYAFATPYGGSATATLALGNLPAHSHTIASHSHTASATSNATSTATSNATSSQDSHTHTQQGAGDLVAGTSYPGMQLATGNGITALNLTSAQPNVYTSVNTSVSTTVATTVTVAGSGQLNTDWNGSSWSGTAAAFPILPPYIVRTRIIKT